MIDRLKDWLILGLLAALIGVGVWGSWSHQKAARASERAEAMRTQRDAANASLKAVLEDRDRQVATATERAKRADQRRRLAERQKKDLEDALKASPDWADQPVPDGVWRNLGPAGDPPRPAPGAGTGVSSADAASGTDERRLGPVAERIRAGPGGLQ